VEGINSQIGQTFAGNTATRVSNRDVQVVEQGTNLPQPERLSEDVSSVNPQRNVNSVETQSSEQSRTAQVNVQSADNSSSEQRNETLELEEASRDIEQFLQSQNRNLAFSVDEGTDRSVVTVTESDSGEVIRQIPSEEVLRLAERLDDLRSDVGSSVGVLFNNQV
jgi:flagellar protein FlaG